MPDSSSVLEQIYAFIFSDAPLSGRVKVLQYLTKEVVALMPFPDEHALKMMHVVEQTGDIPSLDFMLREHDFTREVGENALSYPDAMTLLQDLREVLVKSSLQAGLLRLAAEDNEGKSVREIRDKVARLAGTVPLEDDQGIVTPRASDLYKRREDLPAGLLTFIKPIDNLIGGVEVGTILTILGFTGSFKTTALVNILYNNIALGYNMAFLTLEIPKDILILNLLSRHSYNPKFLETGQRPVESSRIRKNMLTDEEKKFLFDVVEPDLYDSKKHGEFVFLDPPDFGVLDAPAIRAKLARLDFDLDALCVDYIQLFQYLRAPSHRTGNLIDYYVQEFKNLAMECNGRRISVVLASQANREGYKRAMENDGQYDLLALSEARELERTSSYVLPLFTDDALRESGEVKAGLIKNRTGVILEDPVTVFVDPRYSVLGEDVEGFAGTGEGQDLTELLEFD